ncbi:hypothetical protein MUY14_06940 [Amycolatopsis sp. FBCC-B4732]|uniref:hypothetical protein n=1 Tax=Amycolatopsis sp. FBCC-B4732 TaxID=3079339 RepID=UPI001FF3686A|nr:hypothetical protein [Amycolatopsis sp. FBCC-B4732]UOX90354.1 hypothetical protein MUY14_06940 [Amycolatopsis sp. FBCC-B4732]
MQITPDGTTALTRHNGIDFTHEFADLNGALDPAHRWVGQRCSTRRSSSATTPARSTFGLPQERRDP